MKTRDYMITRSLEDYPASYEEYVEKQAFKLLDNPLPVVSQNKTRVAGADLYYRLQKIETPFGPAVIFTYMDGEYANELRTSLMDGTMYATVLAFF